MQTDVIVVGLGPTGATAANLLASLGLRTLVVERDQTLYPRQRAIAIDEDALRIWQGIGLLEPMLSHMHSRVTLHLHHRNRIFLSCDLDGRGRQGLPGTCFFHQPWMEQTLRDRLTGPLAPLVQIHAGDELMGIDQDADGVTARLRRRSGQERQVRARYLLGCDGGSSTTRKLLGAALLGHSLDEPWIDIQARALTVPDPAARLDFNFIADPDRPAAEGYAGAGLYRWEFRLRRDEDPQSANTPAGIASLLASRGVDAGALEILQSWVYVFHVRQAERWQQGRVFLCGDAAHIMPPFTGQGISSGIRDVGNLCWKLAAVLRGDSHPALLRSYESERRPHVAAVTRFSSRVGRLVMVQNPALARSRDIACRVAVRLPWIGPRIRSYRIKPEWISGPGWFAPRHQRQDAAGTLLWQPWVVPANGTRCRLDDLLGPGWSYLSWREPRMPAQLRERHVREWLVHQRARSWHGLAENAFVDIEDRLRLLFRRHRARGLLIRPDRFIYGSDRDLLEAARVGESRAGLCPDPPEGTSPLDTHSEQGARSVERSDRLNCPGDLR